MRTIKIAPFGILTLAVALAQSACLGAAWEGTDDFSGTLAQWDTTYLHPNQPSNGFFLSSGALQFIRTTTTTAYESSGALLWPKSFPFDTNWTVLVDAHLKPASVKSTTPPSQDIRAALYVFESIATTFSPIKKRLGTALGNGASTDVIQMEGPDLPVVDAGWDFTLGISFDASTKTGRSFYYPVGQPSQLVGLTSLNMGTWTNMQIMLYGLSEYWAMAPGEFWLDNFHVFGATNNQPTLALVKALKPSFDNLILGQDYQLQVSSDMVTWTNYGSSFTATNTSIVYPQYWDVDNWNKLFFRVQLTP